MNMSAHGQCWEGSAFDYTSCIEQPLPLLCTGQRGSKAAACRSQSTAGCIQKVSPTHPPPLLQVSPALRWNHTLKLWLAEFLAQPAANSCGLALLLLPSQCQRRRPAASPSRSQHWEPAGLKWAAAAHSKTSTDADIHEKREWKCLSWQPCGTQPLQHQPASQSNLPPYPVKLITKYLRQRPKSFTANTLLVWLTALLILLHGSTEACSEACLFFYSLRKGSRSYSPPMGLAILNFTLPDITGTRSWQCLGALLFNSTWKIVYKQNTALTKVKSHPSLT